MFDWTGRESNSTFAVSSPYEFDLSKLYTTGEVKLLSAPLLSGDFDHDGHVSETDIPAMLTALTDLTKYEGDYGFSNEDLKQIADTTTAWSPTAIFSRC